MIKKNGFINVRPANAYKHKHTIGLHDMAKKCLAEVKLRIKGRPGRKVDEIFSNAIILYAVFCRKNNIGPGSDIEKYLEI